MNITLPGARLGGLSPVAWGLIIAGVLFFAIVAIVRSVTAPTPAISLAANAGVAAIQAPLQSNVGAALPAFQLVTATPQPTVGAVGHQTIVPDVADPAWMQVVITADGYQWIWADGWFTCRWLAEDGSGYSIGDSHYYDTLPDTWQWMQLPAITQREMQGICQVSVSR